jgi:two-component system NtrC family response regulator
MTSVKVLLVEDERNQRILLRKVLEKRGYIVGEAASGNEAVNNFKTEDFDLVLLDQRLPDMQGSDVLEKIKDIDPTTPVIIITAFANIHDAVSAMKHGAFHYLTKPVNRDELFLVMKNAYETLTLKRENAEFKKYLKDKYHHEKIVSVSREMEKVISTVFRAARSDANVLITGESGTGKELVAGAIHNISRRKEKNFVIADLAAMPQTLIEAELFGHERGAFTGADKRRIGKFEFASGGTIFLDEVGELPQNVQVKLLRVIQSKKIVRLGSNDEISVDARLICATNKDIEEEVRTGNFRDDLYYRLNVVRIHVPSLRERKDDIPTLVDHFIRIYSTKEGRPIKGITDEAMNQILRYDFPGNIRELENIIERSIVLARGDYITTEDVPVSIVEDTSHRAGGKLIKRVEGIEKKMIKNALERHKGKISKAASDLGISERVLRYKIKKYKIH